MKTFEQFLSINNLNLINLNTIKSIEELIKNKFNKSTFNFKRKKKMLIPRKELVYITSIIKKVNEEKYTLDEFKIELSFKFIKRAILEFENNNFNLCYNKLYFDDQQNAVIIDIYGIIGNDNYYIDVANKKPLKKGKLLGHIIFTISE